MHGNDKPKSSRSREPAGAPLSAPQPAPILTAAKAQCGVFVPSDLKSLSDLNERRY
jgi:hypothetical protein